MQTTSQHLEAYNEAKQICEAYKNYKGDKRSISYKRLQNIVIDVYMHRMNNFGSKLNLPTFNEYFYD